MSIQIDRYMSRNVITAHWTEEMNSAYNKMSRVGIRHLPVVDDTGEIVGIISDRDFQRAMVRESDSVAGYFDKVDFEPGSLVREYMSRPVCSVSEDTDVKTVAHLMIDKKISAVLIVSNRSRPVGIITHEDLLRILAEILDAHGNSMMEDVEALAYTSPIGPIASSLSQIGI